jgi:ABC-type glutathione transport system ATPase component
LVVEFLSDTIGVMLLSDLVEEGTKEKIYRSPDRLHRAADCIHRQSRDRVRRESAERPMTAAVQTKRKKE